MTVNIGFLVFPQFQLLDLAGPYDVFASVPGFKLYLIWKDRQPVVATSGWTLAPDTALEDCPDLDVLCVPGGSGVNALIQDAGILNFLRLQAAKARFVTSVCTGSLVLGAAGLLRGRKATTHWAFHHLLSDLGAIPVEERVVTDGKFITGGGVTAGIDFGLTVVAKLAGKAEAEAAQLELEYAPAPPFNAGSPYTAPAEVVARVRADSARNLAERARIIAGLGPAA